MYLGASADTTGHSSPPRPQGAGSVIADWFITTATSPHPGWYPPTTASPRRDKHSSVPFFPTLLPASMATPAAAAARSPLATAQAAWPPWMRRRGSVLLLLPAVLLVGALLHAVAPKVPHLLAGHGAEVGAVDAFGFVTRASDDAGALAEGIAAHDCAALGRRVEPAWVDREAAVASIPEFLSLYAGRQVKENAGGMRADHSFGLFTVVRALQPKVFIESGVFKAHASWLVSAALPGTKIVSIDPNPQSCESARRGIAAAGGDPTLLLTCMTGEQFVDFAAIDWDSVLPGEDVAAARDSTLVLIDDHNSGPKRLMEASLRGFTHTIFDDNYSPTMKGDIYSVKQACARSDAVRAAWSGDMTDRFATVRSRGIPWSRHIAAGDAMASLIDEYYELPPLATFNLSQQTRVSESETAPPLVSTLDMWQSTGLSALPLEEYSAHTHIAYVKLR